MTTMTPQKPELSDGDPLAVCINDCQLDYGQPGLELVRVCFQVRCAFAEMRWGTAAAAAFEAARLTEENHTTTSR